MADRFFPGYKLWRAAAKTGALICRGARAKTHAWTWKTLARRLYLSRIYASTKDRRKKRNGIVVRGHRIPLENVADAELLYRLITTISPTTAQAPAKELAALYHEQSAGEIETNWTN